MSLNRVQAEIHVNLQNNILRKAAGDETTTKYKMPSQGKEKSNKKYRYA